MIMMLSGQRTIWTKQCEDNQEISVRLAQWSIFTVLSAMLPVVHAVHGQCLVFISLLHWFIV